MLLLLLEDFLKQAFGEGAIRALIVSLVVNWGSAKPALP